MQIKEIVWADSNSQYSFKEQPDGSIELSVDGQIVNFHERQAVEALIGAWAYFDPQSHSQAEEQPNPSVIENPSSSVSTDFPKKVRNSIFVMVSLGITILIIDALRNII